MLKPTKPEIGRKAPLFTAKTFDGQSISLKKYSGSIVALVFYPRDLTPTCTVEVCNLRDHYDQLKKAGVVIVGISADDDTTHRRFSEKNGLPFPLIADPLKKIIGKYGVWTEKQLYGKKYMGIVRTTFLIDQKGKVLHIFEKVQSGRHAEQILEFLENLN